MTKGRHHVFMETNCARYLHQLLGRLHVVLITTKDSNIFEDTDTLQLSCQVIPKYCRTLDEKYIFDNCFNLIFAFDEIITLGLKENLSLTQICKLRDMSSEEEKLYNATRNTKIAEANKKAKNKAKELQKAMASSNINNVGENTPCPPSSSIVTSQPSELPNNQPSTHSNKALKLGKGSTGNNSPLFNKLH